MENRGNAFTFWASEVLVYTYETDVPVTSICMVGGPIARRSSFIMTGRL